MNTWRDKALSLAGVTQATDMVEQLAKSGYLNTEDFTTCVHSLFILNPESVDDVYGGAPRLLRGLEVLERVLTKQRAQENNDVLKYSLGLFHLQKKLAGDKKMLNSIASKLEMLEEKRKHFDITHDNIVASVAEIYSDTISTFTYRIQVTGEYHYLQQARVANQIRALLMAGIRSTMLWRQVGGSRLSIIFQRKALLEATRTLIQQIKPVIH